MQDKWLLLRGLGREHAHWLDFPERLRAASGVSEVVCVDLPGTGTEYARAAPHSITDNADDVLQRLVHREDVAQVRWWVFGISLGGMVALEMATRAELQIAGVVIANSSSPLSRSTQRMRITALPRLLVAMATSNAVIRERKVLALTSNKDAHENEAVAEELAAAYRQRPMARQAVFNQLRAAARFELPQKLSVPLLVLSSRRDRLVNPCCSVRLAHHFGAQHKVHPRAGHDLVVDDCDWVCEQVRRWQAAHRPPSYAARMNGSSIAARG